FICHTDLQIYNNIYGTKSDITKAKKLILGIVKEFKSQTIITMNIDPQYHKYLIGSSGTNSYEVTLKDNKKLVKKIKIELERLVEEQINLTNNIKESYQNQMLT
ncbi:15953_t:CDS:2, partial [Gigaspora margarita]